MLHEYAVSRMINIDYDVYREDSIQNTMRSNKDDMDTVPKQYTRSQDPARDTVDQQLINMDIVPKQYTRSQDPARDTDYQHGQPCEVATPGHRIQQGIQLWTWPQFRNNTPGHRIQQGIQLSTADQHGHSSETIHPVTGSSNVYLVRLLVAEWKIMHATYTTGEGCTAVVITSDDIDVLNGVPHDISSLLSKKCGGRTGLGGLTSLNYAIPWHTQSVMI